MKDRCSDKQVLGYVLTVGVTTVEILEQSLAGMFTRLVMKEKLNSAQLQPASEITNERRCVSYVRRYRKVRSSSIVKGKVVQSLQRLIETESKISLQVGDC
ncbi:hypothetical protein Tco_0478578 [Tanacetum coccineum]